MALQPDHLSTITSKYFFDPFKMTQVRYNLRRATHGVRATTPAENPETQNGMTSPLTSPNSEAVLSHASSPSRTGDRLYSEASRGQVSRTSMPPNGRDPDGGISPSEKPAGYISAETLMQKSGVNNTASVADKANSRDHSLDIITSENGCPVYEDKYKVHCSTQESSTSEDDNDGWITVKRKKDRRGQENCYLQSKTLRTERLVPKKPIILLMRMECRREKALTPEIGEMYD